MRRIPVALLATAALLSTVIASHAEEASPVKSGGTAEALQRDIAALKVPRPAWREISWRSCLLEGLREARAKNKPAMLWVFIDRPIDDERC